MEHRRGRRGGAGCPEVQRMHAAIAWHPSGDTPEIFRPADRTSRARCRNTEAHLPDVCTSVSVFGYGNQQILQTPSNLSQALVLGSMRRITCQVGCVLCAACCGSTGRGTHSWGTGAEAHAAAEDEGSEDRQQKEQRRRGDRAFGAALYICKAQHATSAQHRFTLEIA